MPEEDIPTEFLPARRLSRERILEISLEISNSPASWALGVMPLAVAIVNDTRQIVYANDRFVQLANVASPTEVLGFRPGEALGCMHAFESEGGCGTTRFCQYCGAAQAIVKSLGGSPSTQECSINRKTVTELDALSLQVWASPMEQGERRLVLNSILDIAHEKTLRGFERIFFHDIMNAVAGIKGIHDVISLDQPQRYSSELDLLGRAIEDIQNIIETQRDFLAVEAREYQHECTRLNTKEVLHYLVAYCQSFNVDGLRNIRLDPNAPSLPFSSDVRILQRILVNMIKNALEASKPGETVLIGCEQAPDGSVVLWVHNTTPLNEETQAHLFQKGYSTKARDRGFGTYSMRLFARQCLGGDVDFETRPDWGTRFFLKLPG